MPGANVLRKGGPNRMNTSALFLMVSVQVVVTFLTTWLFIKVLVTKPKSEPDSYSKNDEVER